MSRLSRAETQERTRARVLAAAGAEFAARGYRDARIDTIAERAGLTRGAVYSNFPGKRALYLAVLAERALRAEPAPHATAGTTAQAALGALARAWTAESTGDPGDPGESTDGGADGLDLVPEIARDERLRSTYAELFRLDALLLGLALERLSPPAVVPGAPPARLVRLAGTVLTTLHGARHLGGAAPGVVEPYDVVSAAERLAGLRIDDWWAPPHVAPAVDAVDDIWAPGTGHVDLVSAEPVDLMPDGVVAVLGVRRLAAAEQIVRAVPAGAVGDLTAVVVTDDPAELGPLARLVLAQLCGCLRQAFPRSAWPRLRVVTDHHGQIASAAGLTGVDDFTEVALRVSGGRVRARAEGADAGHRIATSATSSDRPAANSRS